LSARSTNLPGMEPTRWLVKMGSHRFVVTGETNSQVSQAIADWCNELSVTRTEAYAKPIEQEDRDVAA
jgi:hypothetical protein